jgi:hypothetical protein
VNGISPIEPDDSTQDVDSAVLVTRAGSQANRYSIELSEAVRALVRATASEPAIPASELMVVLGHLSTAGYGLAQGLLQLATCLHRSTEQGLYWAAGKDADWSEVAAANLSVGAAAKSLTRASQRAEQWGELAGRAGREVTVEAAAVEVRLINLRGVPADVPDLEPEPEEESPEDWFVDKEWLSVEEAAEVAGVALNTMRNPRWRRNYGAPVPETHQGRLQFRCDEGVAYRQQRRGAA